MRTRILAAVLLSAALAARALAMPGMSSKPDNPPPVNPSQPPGTEAQTSGPRQEAERSYALAYEEITKAKKDLENGKAKNAEKKFRRALERVESAVALDARYHEAWNLVGYAARKLGDYDKAFSAYEKCLSIKPDYAPAREYLGEARLEKDDLGRAQEQLVMLQKLNADSDETRALDAAIAAYRTAHPEAAAAGAAATPADSTVAKTGDH